MAWWAAAPSPLQGTLGWGERVRQEIWSSLIRLRLLGGRVPIPAHLPLQVQRGLSPFPALWQVLIQGSQ